MWLQALAKQLRTIIMLPPLAASPCNNKLYHAHSTLPAVVATYFLMPGTSAASDNQSNNRIQNKQIAATHEQHKSQWSKRELFRIHNRMRNSINTVHGHQNSTHIFGIHISFGADQKLSHWQMTISGSCHERSTALKRSVWLKALAKQHYTYRMTPYIITALTNSKSMNECKKWNHAIYHSTRIQTKGLKLCLW